MQLVAPLIGGVTGAEGGVAQVFTYATTTRATYYQGFEGKQAVADGSDIQLDAHGSAQFYVNTRCTILVLDVNGVAVRSFVAGESASAVELVSSSSTGTDYVTGVTATGKPTTVANALSLWKTSAGSTNFQVSMAGTAVNLSVISEGLYNFAKATVSVKAFGALGDGVTDDGRAIGKAIAFAANAGGGVYFPPGTYLLSTTLVVPGTVALLGAGRGVSFIKQSSASARILSIQSSTAPAYINGFTLQYSAATAEFRLWAIDVLPNSRVFIANCDIGTATVPCYRAIAVGSNGGLDSFTDLMMDACTVYHSLIAYHDFRRFAPVTVPTLRRCSFVGVSLTISLWMVDSAYVTLDRCVFSGIVPFVVNSSVGGYVGASNTTDFTQASSATTTALSPRVIVVRCTYANPSSGTAFAVNYFGAAAGTYFTDRSTFGGNVVPGGFYPPAGMFTQELLARVTNTTDDTANGPFVDNTIACTTVLKRTNTTTQSIYLGIPCEGMVGRLFVNNASGGTVAVFVGNTFDGFGATGDFSGFTGWNLTNAHWYLWEWVCWALPGHTIIFGDLGVEVPARHFALITEAFDMGVVT